MWLCAACWRRPKISPQQMQRSTKLLRWERNSWKNSVLLTIAAGTMDYSLVTCPSKLTLGCSRHPACLYKSIAGLALLSGSVILGQTWIQSVLLCFSHSEPKKSKRQLLKRIGFVAVWPSMEMLGNIKSWWCLGFFPLSTQEKNTPGTSAWSRENNKGTLMLLHRTPLGSQRSGQ